MMRAPNSPESDKRMSTHTTTSHKTQSDPPNLRPNGSDDPRRSQSKGRLVGWPVVTVLAVAVGAVGGCGSSASPAPASPTVVVRQTVATPATQTVTVQATVAASVPEPSKVAAKSASMVTVPDGVGMNYQEAQDAWRAAGLHVAPAEDATGANRIPVLDRNWVVVSQDLQPGSKVAADSFITATVKKFTDG